MLTLEQLKRKPIKEALMIADSIISDNWEYDHVGIDKLVQAYNNLKYAEEKEHFTMVLYSIIEEYYKELH